MVVSVGEWREDSEPAGRVAFAIHLWIDNLDLKVAVVEPDQIPWHSNLWGKVLTRHQALHHHWLPLVLKLTDQVAREDGALLAFLEPGPSETNS
jgi:hypothetical protein